MRHCSSFSTVYGFYACACVYEICGKADFYLKIKIKVKIANELSN